MTNPDGALELQNEVPILPAALRAWAAEAAELFTARVVALEACEECARELEQQVPKLLVTSAKFSRRLAEYGERIGAQRSLLDHTILLLESMAKEPPHGEHEEDLVAVFEAASYAVDESAAIMLELFAAMRSVVQASSETIVEAGVSQLAGMERELLGMLTHLQRPLIGRPLAEAFAEIRAHARGVRALIAKAHQARAA